MVFLLMAAGTDIWVRMVFIWSVMGLKWDSSISPTLMLSICLAASEPPTNDTWSPKLVGPTPRAPPVPPRCFLWSAPPPRRDPPPMRSPAGGSLVPHFGQVCIPVLTLLLHFGHIAIDRSLRCDGKKAAGSVTSPRAQQPAGQCFSRLRFEGNLVMGIFVFNPIERAVMADIQFSRRPGKGSNANGTFRPT